MATSCSLDTLPTVVSLRLHARVTSSRADVLALSGEAATRGCDVTRCCRAAVDDDAASGVIFFAPLLGDTACFPATGSAGADCAAVMAALAGDELLSGCAEFGRELTGDWFGPTWECTWLGLGLGLGLKFGFGFGSGLGLEA